MFAEGLDLVQLARTDAEKEQAIGILLELAAHAREGAFEEVERTAGVTLGSEHRLTRFAKAASLLAAKNADEAAPVVDSLRDDGNPLWRQFAATLCFLCEDKKGALEHLEAASRILARPEVLERTALLAMEIGRDETAEEVLGRLTGLRPGDAWAWRMLAGVCVRLGRHGRAATAFARLAEIEPDVLEHGVNHAKSLALSGRREAAVRAYDVVCARHPHLLEALGGRAHLLDVLGRPGEALSTLAPVREIFWSEPAFLLLYLSLGYRANREEDSRLALARLLEVKKQGVDVPLWSFTLDELFEEFRARHRAHEECNQELLRGHIPWLAAGRAAGRPALGDWAFRSQSLAVLPDDPHWRAEFTIYSTNGWTVRADDAGVRALHRITACPSRGQTVVVDLSSLITLQSLGLLDRAASRFGKILLPASYSELALRDQTDYQPHQPSRINAAREIRDAVDRGRIVALAGDVGELPLLLDEHGDGPAYRLRDAVSWLHQEGHIDEARAAEVLADLRDKGTDGSLPPIAESARRGFLTTVMTLETAIEAGLFPTLIAATKISLPGADVGEVRARLWASEHQARLAREHEELWATVQGDERFEQVEVRRPDPEEGIELDQRMELSFDAALLAEARGMPLLADDRCLQAIFLNGRPGDACATFGTDCLLLALAESGAITEDELADAFLRLVQWRYRFLVPPVRVLTTLAARHRAHRPERRFARWVGTFTTASETLGSSPGSNPPIRQSRSRGRATGTGCGTLPGLS